MSDIFISYAREDQRQVEQLARALVAQGWTVFWDRTIPAGKTWREVIGNQLDAARCVVVVWSRSSIVSEWVLEEADAGKERGVLVPVLIEQVRAPLGFRSVQAADLSTWDGTTAALSFAQFLSDISGIPGFKGSEQPGGTAPAHDLHLGTLSEDQRFSDRRNIYPATSTYGVATNVEGASSLFVPMSPRGALWIFLAAALGSYLSPRVAGFAFEFVTLQIMVVAFLGYRYGTRIGLIAGVLVFLPNFLGHVYGYSATTFGGAEQSAAWQGTLFAGSFRFPFGGFRTYGIAYFYVALVGAASALLRERLYALLRQGRYDPPGGLTPLSVPVLIVFVICGYLLAHNVSFGHFSFGAHYLGFLIPMVLIYWYGPVQAGSAIRLLLPAACISYFGKSLILGYEFSSANVILVCLSITAFACITRDSPRNTDPEARGMFWALTVLLVIFGSWRFNLDRGITFYSAWAALPLVMLIGSRCGSHPGFIAGAVWGWANIINFQLSPTLGYSAPVSFLIAAPVLGYLGGASFSRREFLVTGAILLACFYFIAVVGRFAFTGFSVQLNFDELISPIFGFIVLIILSPLRHSSDVQHRSNLPIGGGRR